ncbi:MAG: Fuc2NAc and GlcNAc transferase [Alcanivorax sp.]|jgi:Fuc2NAc and GlcNAc transferase
MIVVMCAFVASALGCWVYLKLAQRWNIVDRPNDRSSHTQATPHGGGIPLLLSMLLAMSICAIGSYSWHSSLLILAGLALALTLLGVVDDMRGLSVKFRFACYSGTAALGVWWLTPEAQAAASLTFSLFSVLAILWALNLYNFMDGIDGIAAVQCFLAASGAGLLVFVGGNDGQYALFCLILAFSHLGFLIWNWPPARLFMGDAGSVPTGFLLAGLAFLGEVSGALPAVCWLILLAIFITDSSWTLCWRLSKGHRIFQAHRLHAYQRLSRHWQSHLAVDFVVIAMNALWLFPLAWAAKIWPEWQLILVIVAYFPLLCAMAKLRQLP